MERSRSRLNPIQSLMVADRENERAIRKVESIDRSIDWIALTLLNGFTNYGGGYATAACKRHSSGIVEVRGLVANGTTPGAPTNIAQLPQGFRPSAARLFDTDGTATKGRFDINASGYIVWQQGITTYFSLECMFSAEQ